MLVPSPLNRRLSWPLPSYLSVQDVDSEQTEHTGPAHITNTDVGLLKGQNVQPVNGVISRY